jgi:uncharacterized membrane protein YagU involved in acid resistance
LFRRGDALSHREDQATMVRWSDGLYGGLIAGIVSALFFMIVGVAIDHGPPGLYFSQYAIGIFGEGAERLGLITLLFGLFLHFLAAAVFGIVYAVLAARFKPMWSAPTSVLSGIVYGLVMYFVAEDVTVPVLHVISYTPAWEALVGNVLFHGLVLSEYITISHRRNVAAIA